MNVQALLLVALGGALGSVARAVVGRLVVSTSLPWATILVNILGSLVIGIVMARMTPLDATHLRAHSFWVLGVCGGFTTFSSFSWQTFEQLQGGNVAAALGNVFISVVVCLAATWLGWRLAR